MLSCLQFYSIWRIFSSLGWGSGIYMYYINGVRRVALNHVTARGRDVYGVVSPLRIAEANSTTYYIDHYLLFIFLKVNLQRGSGRMNGLTLTLLYRGV